MPTLFVRVDNEDEDGEPTYVELEDWDEVEIPENVIHSHPEFEKIKDEAARRRIALRETKKQYEAIIASLEDEGEDDKEENPVPTEENRRTNPEGNQGVQFESKDELLTFVMSELQNREAQQQQAAKQKQEQIATLASQHNISDPDLVALIASSTNPEQTAEVLGRKSLEFGDTNVGDPHVPAVDDLVGKVAAKLNLSN